MALKIKLVSTIVALLCVHGFASASNDTTAKKLFNVLPDANTSTILECINMQGIDSCVKVEIDFEAMRHASEIILAEEDGIVFKRVDSDDLSSNSQSQVFSFQGEDFSYAVLTYTEEPGYPDLNGRIHYTKDGASFMVDNCGDNCHVLIKLGESLMTFEEPKEMPQPPGARALNVDELDPVVGKTSFPAFHISVLKIITQSFIFTSAEPRCTSFGVTRQAEHGIGLHLRLLHASISKPRVRPKRPHQEPD